MILFDAATARQLLQALALLEGRLSAAGRPLAVGIVELREAALRSAAAIGGQPSAEGSEAADDALVLPQLLTYEDLADRLQISPRSARRLVATGALEPVRILGQVRFVPDDVAAYIERLRQEAA